MIRDINIDQIKKVWILDLIVQYESFKKAALHAKVSPSAISQSITSLEESYGMPLLIREKGSVRPTFEALELLSTVRPAFDAFDRLNGLKNESVPKISWMNFGTYESIAIDLLPGLLHSLRTKLPNMRLSLRISRTSNLLSMVRKGELCVAIITEVDNLEKFYVKEISNDRLGFFVSKKHSISRLGWDAIEEYGYGSLSPGKDGLPRYFSKYMKQFHLKKATILSDSFEALRATACSGSIVAVLPINTATRFDDLLEISPPNSSKIKYKESGLHKILAVSQLSCDRDETDFIALESSRILKNLNAPNKLF